METKRTLIAPSILSADFAFLADGLNTLKISGADWVHVDVMDGHFVPNLTFGPPVIKALRKHSQLPFDVHLMIEQPERWIEVYKEAGADRLTFHLEACNHAHRYLSLIKELGMASGITLNPQTPVDGLENILEVCDQVLIMSVNPGFGGQKFIESSISKIKKLKETIQKNSFKTLIQVDGGISLKNAQRIVDAGADVLVMGSAFFSADDKISLVKEVQSLK